MAKTSKLHTLIEPVEKPIGLAAMTIEETDAELEKEYMEILEVKRLQQQ